MTPEIVGVICVCALFSLLAIGVNVAVSMGVIGLAGILILAGPDALLHTMSEYPFKTVAVWSYTAFPLFLLMGEFAFQSGITKELFDCAYKWIGHLPGGLGIATMIAAAGFGAVSGSTLVAAATMARLSWEPMMRFQYDKGLASGIVASSGCLAVLIPPSAMAILYGIFTHTPIGPILIGGLIPGVATAFLFSGIIFLRALRRPKIAPRGDRTSWLKRIESLKGVWGILTLSGLILGGMYLGFFTVMEAAAVGCSGAFLQALLLRRLNWRRFRDALLAATRTTSFIFLIIIGAYLFSRLLTLSDLPFLIGETIGGLPVPRIVILCAILLMYVGLGCVMDAVSMLAVSIGTTFPIVMHLGYDPVWFGIVICMMVEVACITPPVGLNVYAVKGVLGDEIETWTIFKNVLPFLYGHVIMISLVIAFPQFVLYLPSHMKG